MCFDVGGEEAPPHILWGPSGPCCQLVRFGTTSRMRCRLICPSISTGFCTRQLGRFIASRWEPCASNY